jgi:hypothetical protein
MKPNPNYHLLADPKFLLFLAVQIFLAAYVYWNAKRGFIVVGMTRVSRKNDPEGFKRYLRSYLVTAALLAGFTVWLVVFSTQP